MTAPTCSRCAAPFEYRTPSDTRCKPCEDAVNRLIAADVLRRAPRFSVAKELAR